MNPQDSNKVIITCTLGKYFLWSEKDALFLRTKHRICGAAIGSLPRKPWQNNAFSLPVILMSEEVCLCVLKGIARVFEPKESYFSLKGDLQNIEETEKQRTKTEEEQIKIFKRDRMQKSKLYYGKMKSKKEYKSLKSCKEPQVDNVEQEKLEDDASILGNVDRKSDEVYLSNPECSTDKNLDTIISVTEEDRKYYDHSLRVHLPTSTEILKNILDPLDTNFLSTQKDKVRFAVYKNLWDKGYYITSAEKFGGDFLVYTSDPLRYHSNFIVVILEKNESLTSKQMVYYGRLGSSVKKTVSLASFSEDDSSVTFISLQWTSLKIT